MRKINWRTLQRIFWPNYALPRSAATINRRWLQKQAFVLGIGSASLTVLTFPLYHALTVSEGESALIEHPHRLTVVVVAFISSTIPLLFHAARKKIEYVSAFNLLILFACVAIDIALSVRQRRYTAIGLIPLFGSTFVFTNAKIMSTIYALSAGFFASLTISFGRSTEIIAIYLVAYFIAWWMAMIRIRSLYRISHDQALLYDRRIHDEKTKLARDLHDSLGSDLMQLALQLGGNTPREQLLDLAQMVLAKTKNLVYTIEPPANTQKFPEYVKGYLDRLQSIGRFSAELKVADTWPPLDLEKDLNLQAIFSEWMTNSIRHSKASVFHVFLLARRSHYFLVIIDNGLGFRWGGERRNSGLRNIAMRAEFLKAKIFSRRTGKGTIFFSKSHIV